MRWREILGVYKKKFMALCHFISSEQVISIKDEMPLVSQTLFSADHYECNGCRRPTVLTQGTCNQEQTTKPLKKSWPVMFGKDGFNIFGCTLDILCPQRYSYKANIRLWLQGIDYGYWSLKS